MYWLSREERTGNRPIWLEYDLEVLELTLMMAARMWWELCSCLGWMAPRKYCCDQVEQRFFCTWSSWPFKVKKYWGRCLEIIPADRPGHDVKWPLLMAAMKVELMRLKAAA